MGRKCLLTHILPFHLANSECSAGVVVKGFPLGIECSLEPRASHSVSPPPLIFSFPYLYWHKLNLINSSCVKLNVLLSKKINYLGQRARVEVL